jgi:hypothetical protein
LSGRVVRQVLLQQPVGQFAAQTHRERLTLVERDQLILSVSIEQNLEGRLGLLKPLLTKPIALCGIHGAIL